MKSKVIIETIATTADDYVEDLKGHLEPEYIAIAINPNWQVFRRCHEFSSSAHGRRFSLGAKKKAIGLRSM
jgi:hypothetical protein